MANPDLQKLAKDLSKCVKSKPYNPFAAWKMSENDHTKYLLSVLRYHDADGKYPVLADFLLRFTEEKGAAINCTCPKNVKIEFSHKTSSGKFNAQGFIDGLITFDDDNNEKVGIIIENKIHGACDQENQVRNYISHLKPNIRLENIWVFYITSDGIKVVDSTKSYNVEAEEEDTNIGNRFIEINYKEDITEWLQNDILNNGYYPESLTSIVRTYFNYLHNDLFCDDIDINWQNKFLKEFDIPTNLNELKPGDWEKLISLRNNVGINDADASIDTTILDVLSSIFERITVLAFDKFERISIEILNKHWAEKLKEIGVTTWQASHHNILTSGYLQLRLVKERNSAHIEWIPISIHSMLFENNYTITLHCEGNSHKELLNKWIGELEPKRPANGKIVRRGCSLKIESSKPLAKMSESELEAFLTKLYNETFKHPISLLVRDLERYNSKGSGVEIMK